MKKERFFHVILIAGLIAAALTSCARYRFDARHELIYASNNQIWGVGLQKSNTGYRVHSVTKLNGAKPVSGEATAVVASGSTGNWQWEVRAVPQLLPSLKAWESNQKVQQRAAGPDSWGHPAATWEQAFTRSYKVANYLLGQTPLPLKLTLLLVPDGSVYDKTVVQTGADYVPITLAFYFPSEASETDALTASRFSALVAAMTTSAYEYQHIFVFTETIKPIGNNKADKAINDEARSQCWSDSVFLALTSGTHTESKWDAAQETVLTETGRDTSAQTKRQPNDGGIERRYSDAWRWGRYLEAKNVSAYLLARGRRDAKVLSNEPEATNAVMSMCRAITQHPLDLTAGEYHTSQVEYVPFFPSGLSPQKPGSPNPD